MRKEKFKQCISDELFAIEKERQRDETIETFQVGKYSSLKFDLFSC